MANSNSVWKWNFIVKRNNGFNYFYARMPGHKIKTPGMAHKTQHFRSAFFTKSMEHQDMLARANPGIVFQIFTRAGEKIGLPLMYIEGPVPRIFVP